MRRIFGLLVSLGLLLGLAQRVQAQSSVELTDVGATYTFGEQITFSARIQTQSSIQAAYLLFQVEGDPNTRTVPLSLATDGTAEYSHLVLNGLLRPFSRIFYWYHLLLANSETFDSPRYFFQYDDNRYPWQTLEDSSLRLHWYAGDVSFGQAAFDAAHAGYQAIQTLIPITTGDPINIYIYASAADVQDTLNLGGYTWIGGHASPDLGVVLVSIAPGETQSIEMERQIPHELAHVLLYRLTGPAYANLPTWLLEGIASQAERYPNANYAQVLAIAAQNKALLPVTDLCGPFPADASGAILAYAESDSFTRYLHETYGTSSLHTLIQSYTDGLTCEQGASRTLGPPLAQLDLRWRQTALGEKATGMAFQNFLPYLVLLGIMLVVPVWRLGMGMQKKELHDRRRPQ
jgi:hypothetical protein